ncbi:MAG: hypothetical protein ACOVOD_08590 [Rhodoferax sp.]
MSEFALPRLKKRVVYLDQSLLSSAYKRGDARSVRIVDWISDLACKQLLVTPHSNVHESETYQWSGYGGKTPAGLMRFIEQAARGLRFQPTYQVEEVQLLKAFSAFISGGEPRYKLDRCEAIPREVDDWHNYVYVSVNRYLEDKDSVASMKRTAVANLVSLFDGWSKSTTTYEQDVDAEIADASRTYMSQYAKYLARLMQGDWAAILDPPVASHYVEKMAATLPRDQTPEDRLARVAEFLRSPYFADTPITALTARIFATLKAMVKAGAFPNREKAVNVLSGIFFDVQHIASYAPYADAIFVDNQMANLVAQPSVALTQQYGTLVFSLNTIDKFEMWLSETFAAAKAEHALALGRAYGSTP